MIEFQDFSKLDLRIGEITSIEGNLAEINCGDKTFSKDINFPLESGDKIVVGILGEKIVVPLTEEKSPLTPDQDIEPGSQIS